MSMARSMYQASIPVFVRMLGNLRTLLEKGGSYAEARKFDATLLADSRLVADMFPLVRQVQIATDGAKSCAARLAGTEAPKYEDTEKTLPEILDRIEKNVAFLNSVTAAQVAGRPEEATVGKG